MRRAASRIRWYSLSLSVRIGATVMLSPVWTPIGSTFSIEQMTTKLSATSRITSSSNSFQPITDSSIEDLVDRAELEPALGEVAELLDVVRDAAADAAQRERRADDQRKAERPARGRSLRPALRARPLCGTSRPISRIASLNSCRSSATLIASIEAPISSTSYLSSVPAVGEVDREIERRLAADRRQQRIGTLALDDRREHFRRQRLDVRAIGEIRIGHDRRRIAVDEHDLEAFGAQRLAGLRARVVELARLADDDRAGADDRARASGPFGVAWSAGLAPGPLDQGDEVVEQIVRVVWTGRSLGMVLDGEDRTCTMPQPFDGPVVQVDVRHRDVSRQRAGIDGEPVVLRGDLDLPGRRASSPDGSRRDDRTST